VTLPLPNQCHSHGLTTRLVIVSSQAGWSRLTLMATPIWGWRCAAWGRYRPKFEARRGAFDAQSEAMCPITMQPFMRQVRAADGCCYEEGAIRKWFAEYRAGGLAHAPSMLWTSPVTQKRYASTSLHLC
jgi:hypothetical protein